MSDDKLRCPRCGAAAQWEDPDDENEVPGYLYCPNGCLEVKYSHSRRSAMRKWQEAWAKRNANGTV